MTQAQWMRLSDANPSRNPVRSEWGDEIVDDRHPVERISWDNCIEVLPSHDRALPTESLQGVANLRDRFLKKNRGPESRSYEEWLDDSYSVHAPVGTIEPDGSQAR